jgi:hypothetical protein
MRKAVPFSIVKCGTRRNMTTSNKCKVHYKTEYFAHVEPPHIHYLPTLAPTTLAQRNRNHVSNHHPCSNSSLFCESASFLPLLSSSQTNTAQQGLALAKPRIHSRAARGADKTCTERFCDIKLDGQFGCTNGTATFTGLCYQRGASNETQPVQGCDGISVEYIVDGMNGAGSGVIEVINTANSTKKGFWISQCKPVSGKIPLGIPCLGLSGSCDVN